MSTSSSDHAARVEAYRRRFDRMTPAEQNRDLLYMLLFVAKHLAEKIAREDEDIVDTTARHLLRDVDI